MNKESKLFYGSGIKKYKCQNESNRIEVVYALDDEKVAIYQRDAILIPLIDRILDQVDILAAIPLSEHFDHGKMTDEDKKHLFGIISAIAECNEDPRYPNGSMSILAMAVIITENMSIDDLYSTVFNQCSMWDIQILTIATLSAKQYMKESVKHCSDKCWYNSDNEKDSLYVVHCDDKESEEIIIATENFSGGTCHYYYKGDLFYIRFIKPIITALTNPMEFKNPDRPNYGWHLETYKHFLSPFDMGFTMTFNDEMLEDVFHRIIFEFGPGEEMIPFIKTEILGNPVNSDIKDKALGILDSVLKKYDEAIAYKKSLKNK